MMPPVFIAHFAFKNGQHIIERLWDDEAEALLCGATWRDIMMSRADNANANPYADASAEEEREFLKEYEYANVPALKVTDSGGWPIALEVVEDAPTKDERLRLVRTKPVRPE